MEPRPAGPAVVGVVLSGGIAAVLSVLVVANYDPLIEGPMTYVPVVVAVWMPAILGAIGLRHPTALLAAGIVSLPLSVLSVGGATLPLLIPAVLYLVGYGSHARQDSRVRSLAVAFAGLVLGIAALVPFFAVGGETVCSKTVVYPSGRTETFRVSESDAQTLTSSADGRQEVGSECREATGSWGGVLSLGVAGPGILLIAYLSKASSGRFPGRSAQFGG